MTVKLTLELELSPTEYRTLARSAAGQQEFMIGSSRPWSLELEAIALLRGALWREAQHQADRDNLARWLGKRQYQAARQVGLGDQAPAAPDWLQKLLGEL